MSKLLQISIPAIIGVILIILYFVLEKSEKVESSSQDKCMTNVQSTVANQDNLEKGQQCYVLNADGKCVKGYMDVDSKGFKRDVKAYSDFWRNNSMDKLVDPDTAAAYTSYGLHCEPADVYYKYDLLLWFGILAFIIAVFMNFVKLSSK